MEPAAATHPYLSGLFAPVDDELTAARLPVAGALPDGLDGIFLRNSPNPRFAPLGRYHWFDGDGMIHAVEIREGAATYRNRFIRTRGFQLEEQSSEALWG